MPRSAALLESGAEAGTSGRALQTFCDRARPRGTDARGASGSEFPLFPRRAVFGCARVAGLLRVAESGVAVGGWPGPLCLQPIAENAVLHGIATREEGGELSIRAEMRNDFLLLSVEDDGSGHGASSHTGTGTAMIDLRTRLELLYGGRAGLSAGERAGGGYRVELRIPMPQESVI